jgi:DNA-binding winged helix-turn-helix (wHTH) protein
MQIRFGEILIIEQDNVLIIDDKPVSISPKAMAVLILLVQNQGTTVLKQDIFELVWKNAVASDAALSRVISDLRSTLNDSYQNPIYIKTISKKGFQAIAEVNYIDVKTSRTSTQNTILAFTAIFMSIVVWWLSTLIFPSQSSDGFQTKVLQFSNQPIRSPRFNTDATAITYIKHTAELGSELIHYSIAQEIETIIRAENKSVIYSPVYSVNKNAINYIISKEGECHIQQQPLTRKSIEPIKIDMSSGSVLGSCWPDNQIQSIDISADKLIMVEVKKEAGEYRYRRRLIDLQTAELINKVEFSFNDESVMLSPRFSNNGDKIAFVKFTMIGGKKQIVTYNIASDSYRYVKTKAQDINQVDWVSRDQSLIFLAVGPDFDGIWSIKLSTNKQKMLHRGDYIDLDYSIKNNASVVTTRNLNIDLEAEQKLLAKLSPPIDEEDLLLMSDSNQTIIPYSNVTKARLVSDHTIAFSQSEVDKIQLLDITSKTVNTLTLDPVMTDIKMWTIYNDFIYYTAGNAEEKSLYVKSLNNDKAKKLFHLKSSTVDIMTSLAVDPTNGIIVKPLSLIAEYELQLLKASISE